MSNILRAAETGFFKDFFFTTLQKENLAPDLQWEEVTDFETS